MPSTAVTRSISFAPDLLAELDQRAKLLRMRRSEYINRLLEQEFGLAVTLQPVPGSGKLPLPAPRQPATPTVRQALPRAAENKKSFKRG